MDSPRKGPVVRFFDVSFDVNQNKVLSKQSKGKRTDVTRRKSDVTLSRHAIIQIYMRNDK